MDEFLRELAKNGITNANQIYHMYVRLGTDPMYAVADFDYLYSGFQNHFKNNSNIKVTDAGYFCVFESPDAIIDQNAYYKVYIPVNAPSLEKTSNAIFEFLSANNIKHISKIGKNIRNDDIVVRLYNEEDVYKLQNFINTNETIKQGLNSPNPFMLSDGNVSIEVDGLKTSYNTVITNYISMYIENCIQTNNYNVNSEDFIKFVGNVFNEIYYGNASEFFSYFESKMLLCYQDTIENAKKGDYNDRVNEMTEVFMISNLFLQQMSSPSFEVLRNSFSSFNDSNYMKEVKQGIGSIYATQINMEKEVETVDIDLKRGLFWNLSFSTYEKFGLAGLSNAIMRAINDNDYSAFIGDNASKTSFREVVNNNEIIDLIKYTLKYGGIDASSLDDGNTLYTYLDYVGKVVDMSNRKENVM